MRFLISLFVPLLLLVEGYSVNPCNEYSVLDDQWRNPASQYSGISHRGHDDSLVEWKGWYRLYLEGKNAKIPETEWCRSRLTCGGYASLWLSESHPDVEDGIVSRDIYWFNPFQYNGECSFTRSYSIHVKACPGGYYVYKLEKPDMSIPVPTYCAVPFNSLNYDPCNNYTSLDQPWRANNATGLDICDRDFNWNGWYRLFYLGMNVRMPERCVDVNRCGAYYTLWLNGPHPEIKDGVVTRRVCANAGSNCCYFKSSPIQVKACPGNYYVYEFVSPEFCSMAYCTDTSIVMPDVPTKPATNTNFHTTMNPSVDPCIEYNVLDNYWRNRPTYYRYTYYRGHENTKVEWQGWYRLYLEGKNAKIPETDWCKGWLTCGEHASLWLSGSHPRLKDGIVTRDIYWSSPYQYYSECTFTRSHSIQVKACPAGYYVYKLEKPDISIPVPTYCAVATDTLNYDPCKKYTALDQPWRGSNEKGLGICDNSFKWDGWYRLFHHGMDILMAESCVAVNRCGTYSTLWLNGPHPEIEDGVVTRQVCGNSGMDCCYYKSNSIRVKACPGNYYVYELVSPDPFYSKYNMGYCTDVSTISPAAAPKAEATGTGLNPAYCKEQNAV